MSACRAASISNATSALRTAAMRVGNSNIASAATEPPTAAPVNPIAPIVPIVPPLRINVATVPHVEVDPTIPPIGVGDGNEFLISVRLAAILSPKMFEISTPIAHM